MAPAAIHSTIHGLGTSVSATRRCRLTSSRFLSPTIRPSSAPSTATCFSTRPDKFDGKTMAVFPVVLHEAGHVFGLPDGTDPGSPMYPTYLGNTNLTSADIANLQALYGKRAPDANEGSGGNDSVSKATTIQPPSGFTGTTPLIAYGDITTNKDVDFFSFRAPSGYTGSVTIRLQSTGISLLTPHLSLVDAKGNVQSDVSASSDFGDTVTLQLANVNPNTTYYLKVQGATSDVFGIGGYGLAITFNGKSTASAAAIDSVLRGPYQSLRPDEISALFTGASTDFFNSDKHGNDDPIAATVVAPSPGYAENSHYEVVGSISSPTDVDYFKVKSSGRSNGNSDAPLDGDGSGGHGQRHDAARDNSR